jgi:hypothetical protein
MNRQFPESAAALPGAGLSPRTGGPITGIRFPARVHIICSVADGDLSPE